MQDLVGHARGFQLEIENSQKLWVGFKYRQLDWGSPEWKWSWLHTQMLEHCPQA